LLRVGSTCSKSFIHPDFPMFSFNESRFPPVQLTSVHIAGCTSWDLASHATQKRSHSYSHTTYNHTITISRWQQQMEAAWSHHIQHGQANNQDDDDDDCQPFEEKSARGCQDHAFRLEHVIAQTNTERGGEFALSRTKFAHNQETPKKVVKNNSMMRSRPDFPKLDAKPDGMSRPCLLVSMFSLFESARDCKKQHGESIDKYVTDDQPDVKWADQVVDEDLGSTVMIRNLPSWLSQQDLLKALMQLGLAGEIVVLYVPSNLQNQTFKPNHHNRYGFLHLRSEWAVDELTRCWHNQYPFRRAAEEQHSLVDIALARVQGAKENLAQWEKTKTSRIRNPKLKPLIFDEALSKMFGYPLAMCPP